MNATSKINFAYFKNHAFALLGLLAFLTVTGKSLAEPITFFFEGTGTGSLGGTAFSSVTFQIISTADTANLLLTPGGGPQLPAINSSISIAGLGLATFTAPTFEFETTSILAQADDMPEALVGIGQGNQRLDLFNNNPALINYLLNSSFGPVPGTADGQDYGLTFQTSAGGLSFSSISDFSFQASAVPEPSSAGIVLAGCAAIFFARRVRDVRLH